MIIFLRDEEIVGDHTREALAEVNQEANEYKHVDHKVRIVSTKIKTNSKKTLEEAR